MAGRAVELNHGGFAPAGTGQGPTLTRSRTGLCQYHPSHPTRSRFAGTRREGGWASAHAPLVRQRLRQVTRKSTIAAYRKRTCRRRGVCLAARLMGFACRLPFSSRRAPTPADWLPVQRRARLSKMTSCCTVKKSLQVAPAASPSRSRPLPWRGLYVRGLAVAGLCGRCPGSRRAGRLSARGRIWLPGCASLNA